MGITEEQFLETDYVKDIIAKYKRSATVLHPQSSNVPLSIEESKFGGIPNLSGFGTYPYCDCCSTPLNFDDQEEGVIDPVPDKWSPHHIMIGDLGNIYFYVCKNCGENSIESYWDCH